MDGLLSTTNNANLDLFTQLVRNMNIGTLHEYLQKSWDTDKLKTIAIIFNARDRLKGKKEKAISNRCLIWLKQIDNKIYKKNILSYINNYGCWNDLNFIINHTKNNNYEYWLFAEQLKKDKELLNNNENISLCAKWAINPNTNKTIRVARYLFDNITNYDVRYRKEYIIPLRKSLDLVETKLCNKDWSSINYSKIPAGALRKYKKTFIKNDNESYSAYLKDVAENKITMKLTGLLPHEIIKKYMDNNLVFDETLELQWDTLVNTYKNVAGIIPIVDVSGSMFSGSSTVKPIYVSIALGLLISSINTGFLHNKIITFSYSPVFLEVKGEKLHQKITDILKSPFGLNTDFLKVADLIINSNIEYKKLICFSDMQFNSAIHTTDVTTMHNEFINKFKNSNKEVPELIYWNLNGIYNNFPIDNNMENTSLISGFSEQLLNAILENENLNPDLLMNKILEPYYKNILI
jgi:hypothetical protein